MIAELEIKKFLKDKLNIPTFTEEPAEVPETYLIIEKVGGSINEHLYTSMIAVKSYSDTLVNTMKLDKKVQEVMLNEALEMSDLTSIDLNASAPYTDIATKRYRYQSIFEIFHY